MENKTTESDKQLERMVAKAKQHPVDLNKLRKLAGKKRANGEG